MNSIAQRELWTCPHCGETLTKTGDNYLMCEYEDRKFMRGQLREAPIATDLPLAIKIDYKRYIMTIDGETKVYVYAVGKHHRAIHRKPDEDVTLARVNTGKRLCIRAFHPMSLR